MVENQTFLIIGAVFMVSIVIILMIVVCFSEEHKKEGKKVKKD